MAPWIALALVGLLLGATNIRAVRGESFNYDLSGTDWPSGKKQSPINIVTSAVKRADGPSLLKVKHPLSREITVTNEEHAAGKATSTRNHLTLPFTLSIFPLPHPPRFSYPAVSPQAGKRYFLTLPSTLSLCSLPPSPPPFPLHYSSPAVSPQAGKRYYLTLPSGLHKLDHSDLQVPSIHLVDGVQAPMEAQWAHGEGAQHPPGGRRAGAHGGPVGAWRGSAVLHPVPSIHLVDGVQAPMEAQWAHGEGLLCCTLIHLVDGVQAPMEAKFAYVNVGNTTRKSVFSVFLKLHPKDKDNAWLNLWLNDIPAAVNGTTKIAAKTNFMELLSFETPFWYYEGSQVHPPCTETVDWFISMRPKFVSTRQGSQVHPPCTETVDWFISMRPKLVSTRQLATYMNFLPRTNVGDHTCIIHPLLVHPSPPQLSPPPFQMATYMNFLSRTNSGDRTNNRLPQPLNARTVSVFRAS
ncbi:unnamed protein product [Closterium sp. Naga37s-1]|nr:unnamed protein product [Closterium sp. Naga37s-1]